MTASILRSPLLQNDEDAWLAYPQARVFYDRLWLARELGQVHGAAGTLPAIAGRYFVKPVCNLLGMGIGARPVEFTPGQPFPVLAGHFWSECFEGEHLSIDYRWDERARRWRLLCCVKGVIESGVPVCWIRQPRRRLPALPHLFDRIADLCDASRLNVEFIGGKVIECHLRSSLGDWRGSPPGSIRAIPVWEGQRVPGGMVENHDDSGGIGPLRRIGFVYSPSPG